MLDESIKLWSYYELIIQLPMVDRKNYEYWKNYHYAATGIQSFDVVWYFQIEHWQWIRVQNQPEKTRLQAEVRK